MKHILYTFLFVMSSACALASPILEQIKNEVAQKKAGLIIMDLDETVIDTHGRKYHSYLEAHRKLCGAPATTLMNPVSTDCEKSLGISQIDFYRSHNGYSSAELMKRLQIQDQNFMNEFDKIMVPLYLSGKWMDIDTSLPGASTYVRELKRSGAEVFFISSRYIDTQGEATFAQLERLGFIEKDDRTHVILRKRGEDSLAFKTAAVKQVAQQSQETGIPVVALFENEPENLNAWKKAFPLAQGILIKGNILVPTTPAPEITTVDDYR